MADSEVLRIYDVCVLADVSVYGEEAKQELLK
jgi:hypothetical protein